MRRALAALVALSLAGPFAACAEEVPEESGSDFVNPMNKTFQSTADLWYALGRDGSQEPDFSEQFSKEVLRIRMRDGVLLQTEIYRPHDQAEPLPVILLRTPYGLGHTDNGYTSWLRMYPELIADGYIFVVQGTRGRNGSEGEHITLGPMRDKSVPGSTDESTDTYDTIEWLVQNLSNFNKRVGTLGISYGGFLTTRALVDPHPALKATSPQATCADMFIGDDWHHNGAFRLWYAFGWISSMESDGGARNMPGYYDAYEAFLALGPLSNVNKLMFHGRAKSWNAFSEHPNLDDYWKYDMCGVLPHIQPVTVPTLNVTGWFDAEDFYGPIEVYKKYESTDERDLNYLVLGPWHHGGWSFDKTGRGLGALDFGSNTAEYFRNEIQGPWFAYWLKDKGDMNLPEARVFRTGQNYWEDFEEWPPTKGIERKNIYFHPRGHLSFDPPSETATDARDEYLSDPLNPVPFRHRPIRYEGWAEWQLEDQRLADGRPDVLSYVTDPLQDDLTITGDAVANIYAATTGTDADWVVKLIDVYPEEYEPEPYMAGFKFMVAGEVFRGRYRNSFEVPEPMIANEVTPFSFSLRDRNHTFRKGHRIMVQIQSSWFPVIDRNPQKYVDNIYEATDEDFIKAIHSIHRTAEFPSHISLPVNTN